MCIIFTSVIIIQHIYYLIYNSVIIHLFKLLTHYFNNLFFIHSLSNINMLLTHYLILTCIKLFYNSNLVFSENNHPII